MEPTRPLPGLLLVLSAPSGAGKTTLARQFVATHPDARFSVSATTRPPRGAERDGVDYHFVTPERFAAAYRLRTKFADKPGISFTDLTSFAVMRELGLKQAVTGDAHFQQVNLGFACVPSLI